VLRFFTILALTLGFGLATAPAQAASADPKNTVIMETAYGKVTIQLRPDLAPNHAERIRALTQKGFYNGVVFHRVIEGFMAQTGDPTGTGTGGSDLPDLKAEFTTKAKFVRGVVGMARSSDPDSANSQFFIMYGPTPSLDGQYTIVGEVVSGMDAIDKIKKGPPEDNGQVTNPDKIIKMTMADGK
jgi:peptidylprolyl isomerase